MHANIFPRCVYYISCSTVLSDPPVIWNVCICAFGCFPGLNFFGYCQQNCLPTTLSCALCLGLSFHFLFMCTGKGLYYPCNRDMYTEKYKFTLANNFPCVCLVWVKREGRRRRRVDLGKGERERSKGELYSKYMEYMNENINTTLKLTKNRFYFPCVVRRE